MAQADIVKRGKGLQESLDMQIPWLDPFTLLQSSFRDVHFLSF
jgi:hypothetical protein